MMSQAFKKSLRNFLIVLVFALMLLGFSFLITEGKHMLQLVGALLIVADFVVFSFKAQIECQKLDKDHELTRYL